VNSTDEFDRLRAGFAVQGPYPRRPRRMRWLAILAAVAALIAWSLQ
jgi:hypothetical protein